VLRQKNVAFYIDLDKRMIWLTQFAGTNATDDSESSSVVLKTIEIAPRVGVSSVQIGDQPAEQKGQVEATFYPNGLAIRSRLRFKARRRGVAWRLWSTR